MWFLGLGGIVCAWRPLGNRFRERQKAAAALSAALTAKEVLLQEVHHRVKNNLQIISSLLNLEAESLPENAQRALEDSQRRIRSMCLVHEQLYNGGADAGELDFAGYARSLTSDLVNAYSGQFERVQLRLELEPVRLGLSQAISCGLILNELVTNALKYAFPGGRTGEVRVELHAPEDSVELRVADNGVGLPPGFDWTQSHSLGLRIVALLTRQLSGTLRNGAVAGTSFTLSFPKR